LSKDIADYYGNGGRLSQGPAQSLIDSAYAHDVEQEKYLLEDLHVANLAHAVMLAEQDLIPSDALQELLPQLIKLVEQGAEIELNPSYGDLYNCVDVFLKNRVGQHAGWLHTGRPRREAVNLSFLLKTRREFAMCFNNLLAVGDALLQLAIEHRSSLMSDYTYLHHAQPTTLGHYLLTFVLPITRDLSRWQGTFDHVNSSPGGSGSVNGSRLPLSKERLAELMGFESVSAHCRDAMWQPDIPLEVASALSISLTNISRLCDEWMIWNSKEFNMIELPDEFCRASVIMPQKKNPYPLAYVRGLSAQISGLFGEYSSLGKVASGFPDSRTFIYDSLIQALQKSIKAYAMLSELAQKVNFNTLRMREIAESSLGFATDFADHLILNSKCDYRTAHTVTGQIVKFLLENKLDSHELRLETVKQILEENDISNFSMDSERLRKLLDADNIVASRITLGSASQAEMSLMLDEIKVKFDHFQSWIKSKQQTENRVNSDLIAAANKILKQ